MTSEWRSGRGVSEREGRSDQPLATTGAQLPRVVVMTAVEVLERIDELTDGRFGSVDAATEGGNRSILEIPADTALRAVQARSPPEH
jgi:hypothetical protein